MKTPFKTLFEITTVKRGITDRLESLLGPDGVQHHGVAHEGEHAEGAQDDAERHVLHQVAGHQLCPRAVHRPVTAGPRPVQPAPSGRGVVSQEPAGVPHGELGGRRVARVVGVLQAWGAERGPVGDRQAVGAVADRRGDGVQKTVSVGAAVGGPVRRDAAPLYRLVTAVPQDHLLGVVVDG